MPAIPRRRPSSRARRERAPRILSRETIVDAALRVVDTEGVDAVTMRRVGLELNTGGASLYAHIEGKDELLELVFDKVIGEFDFADVPDPKRWREQIKAYCRGWHAVLLQHQDLAKVGLGRVPLGPNGVAAMEQMLGIFKASRLSDRVIAFGADLLSQFVTVSAYEASLFIARSGGPDGDAVDMRAEMEAFFSSLPAERYPTLVAMASALVGDGGESDGEARFEFGLDVLVSGLAAAKL